MRAHRARVERLGKGVMASTHRQTRTGPGPGAHLGSLGDQGRGDPVSVVIGEASLGGRASWRSMRGSPMQMWSSLSLAHYAQKSNTMRASCGLIDRLRSGCGAVVVHGLHGVGPRVTAAAGNMTHCAAAVPAWKQIETKPSGLCPAVISVGRLKSVWTRELTLGRGPVAATFGPGARWSSPGRRA
jgi:hypothetical protein